MYRDDRDSTEGPARDDRRMSLQPGGAGDVERAANDEYGVSRDTIEARLPKSKPGAFTLLLIDNRSKRATRVDVRPMTVEAILRAGGDKPSLLSAFLRAALVNAALKIDPDFEVVDATAPLERAHLLDRRRSEKPAEKPRLPNWMRRRDDGWEDHGQGLAEYALVIALIAIIAIIGLLFLGSQVSTTLSIVGESLNV